MTSVPPPPLPLDSTSWTAFAALARDDADPFFFFAADDARAEAPRPAIRLTVILVASSVVFFFAAIFLCWIPSSLDPRARPCLSMHVHLVQPRP